MVNVSSSYLLCSRKRLVSISIGSLREQRLPEADAIVKKMAKDERNLIMIAILVFMDLSPKNKTKIEGEKNVFPMMSLYTCL